MSTQPEYSERHLGPVVLHVRSATLDLYDLVPNPNQPRMGPKDDPELRKNILTNNGLLEPILVEPHPQYEGKWQIIDGERRWFNCKILIEVDKKDTFRKLPVEICDRTLTEEERLRAWVNIHIHRKDWTVKERERTAYKLVQMIDRVKAANILGITVKDVDKLCKTYELSDRMSSIPNPDASITYAREIMNLPAYLTAEPVESAVVKKVNDGIITSSKQIRELRSILKDGKAKAILLQDGTTIDDAKAVLPGQVVYPVGENLAVDLERFELLLKSYTWPQLTELKGKSPVLQRIQECKKILDSMEEIVKK
jgi:ParB family chromosome partitioning protein